VTKKTTRRPNLPSETLERARRELYGAAPQTAAPSTNAAIEHTPTPAVARPAGIKTKRETNLREEYAYVVSDLKNMGILAAVLMAVLVILSFFL